MTANFYSVFVEEQRQGQGQQEQRQRPEQPGQGQKRGQGYEERVVQEIDKGCLEKMLLLSGDRACTLPPNTCAVVFFFLSGGVYVAFAVTVSGAGRNIFEAVEWLQFLTLAQVLFFMIYSFAAVRFVMSTL